MKSHNIIPLLVAIIFIAITFFIFNKGLIYNQRSDVKICSFCHERLSSKGVQLWDIWLHDLCYSNLDHDMTIVSEYGYMVTRDRLADIYKLVTGEYPKNYVIGFNNETLHPEETLF